MAVRLEDGLCYLTSAIRASPTMTCGIPLVNSRTLFLTQSAAFSLEASAASAVKYADGNQHVRAAIKQIIAPEPVHLSHHGHEAIPHPFRELLPRTASHVVFSDTGEHGPALAVGRSGKRCHYLRCQPCSIARPFLTEKQRVRNADSGESAGRGRRHPPDLGHLGG